MEITLPVLSCFNEITQQSVSVDGTSVGVDFRVEPVTLPVCPLPPPLRLSVNLGSFAPDTYQLELSGVINEEPFGPQSAEFEVVRGSTSIPIPTLGPAAWWLMLFAMAITGAVALRQSRI